MTCIVAIKQRIPGSDKDTVMMACDSAATANHNLTIRKDLKMGKCGDFVVGFTSSYRMGQLLLHQFFPKGPNNYDDLENYMNTIFVEEVRMLFKTFGVTRVVESVEQGGEFLVAYKDRLFMIAGDFQVSESLQNFDAIGSGANLALGALHAVEKFSPGSSSKVKLTTALEAAESFNITVRRPFHFLET